MNLRLEIFKEVSSICPLDKVEEEHIDFVLNWINSGVEIFRTQKPATPQIHLVSYFLSFSSEQSKILLVDHKKAELWLPAGGHVEPGEHPKKAVIREAKEELGIEVEFLYDEPIFVTVGETFGNVTKHTDVSLWYLLKGNPEDNLIYDREEFHSISWFLVDEIPFEKSDPNLSRFMEKIGKLCQKAK